MADRRKTPRNTLEFKVWGRYALFTDPLTRVGGEKCSYHLPTYEALKGICKSIYWKPTLIWHVDQVRLMRRIRTQARGMKPLEYTSGGNTLAIYTYLTGDARSKNLLDITDGPGVEYQVRAHFEWNEHRPALEQDRVEGKHFSIAQRSLERGGRQDIFLGTRDCQGYVTPCEFGSGVSDYDNDGPLDYALMFHSFSYPDETGTSRLGTNFWRPKLENGVLTFPRPDDTDQIVHKDIRAMPFKAFGESHNMQSVSSEFEHLQAETGSLVEAAE
ncbi:MAG: type I-C CRISPR-associated protein Cas5c [Acidobacteriaceae bacterium]|nr:type I-C CRISPR-associated protein Cas5c [Acidobacteriaceae bacterium]